MSILAWSRYTNSTLGETAEHVVSVLMITYWPVVVEMTQLVGESLHVVRLEARCVMDDIEAGRTDSTLTH